MRGKVDEALSANSQLTHAVLEDGAATPIPDAVRNFLA